MPEFDGALFRASDTDMLVNLNKSAGSQIRGLGIFESVSGATQPTRDSLPSNNRCDGYIAVIKNVDKVYVFNGDPATDWTTSANWTELGGTGLVNELNDLTAAVTWANVPAANITEASVIQHEAALTIGKSQVTDLSNDLTTIQNNVSQNDTDITTLQTADTTLQNNINTVNTTVSSLDTDDIAEGSNLYNVQADWNSSAGASQILNKPPDFTPSAHVHAISDITNLQNSLNAKVDDGQVLTDVPANAVFTDTTYSVQDGELSQNNFTDALKANLDNQSGTNTGDQDLTSYQLQPSEGAFEDGDKTRLDGIEDNAASITNIINDVTAAENNIDDLQTELNTTQTGAGLNADGTYTANGAANYTASSTSLADADSDLDTQVKNNADAITLNTTHRNIASANPHGTSLGQVSNVSTSGGATNDVLAQNSSGSFDLKNPFDLFMAAAETLSDFPTSGAALGDLDGDGNVGVPDLLLFLANFQNSIFDLSSQSITFTSMSSTPVSIQTSSLNLSDYDGQTTLSNLTKLNIGAQTSDNSISPYDWIVNQTNDYIQFYTTDGSDISGSSGFTYFDNAKVQIANPTNLQASVVAADPDTVFALYCYIETIYSSSTQSQLELVGTYSAPAITNSISVNQDAENPIVINHPLFAVNSGEYPTAARIYFYVGIPEIFEYDTFTCSISDLKINLTQ